MSCVRITESIILYSTQFLDESQRTIANLLGMWWAENPNRYGEFPSISEMLDYIQKLRGETINIWYSSNENKDLSNFAERPINLTTINLESFLQYFDEVFSTLDDLDIKGRLFDIFSNYTFKTVEGAWQAAKMAFSSAYDLNNEEYTEEWEKMLNKFSTVNGAAAKSLGRVVKGLNSTLWDQVSPMIMKVLIKTSFELNPQALKKLLDTGFAKFTHTQARDKDRWKTEFPRVLTEVREELRELPLMLIAKNISTEGTTQQYGVVIDKNLKGNWSEWQKNNPDGIVAYRVNFSLYNSPEEALAGRIGNPFSENARGSITVELFFTWLTTGLNFGNPKATEEYRLAIIKRILATPENSPILYYTELNRPSHATILGYLVNHKELLLQLSVPQTTQLPARNTSKELDTSAFNTPRVSSLQELQTVDWVFDPRVRRDRVTLISRLFSQEVDMALLEKKDLIDTRMMEENLTEAQRDELRKELYSLDRKLILRELTPKGIFDRVKAIFLNYLDDTDEGRVLAELNKINALEQSLLAEEVITEDELFSEEEKLEAAKKRAVYKAQEYKKIVENFRPLAEEASGSLLITEGIRVDLDSLVPKDVNLNDDDPEGNSEVDNLADDYSKEETVKDGWMTNFRFVSSHESLSQAVRKIISETPSLDYEGIIEEDDLGNIRYLDADYVHATLIDKLRYMITSEDMIPLLEDLAKYKPWVELIIEIVNDDDVLFSLFYSDFRKDFIQYWILKKVNNPDGTFKIETISINSPEGVYYLLDSWRDNYESGTILDKDSVYEKNGDINRGNATEGLKIFNELNNLFHNKSTLERLDLLKDEEVWGKLMKMFNMIGIDPNPSILRISLENIKTAPGITYTDPIMLLLPNFQVIFKGILRGEVKSEVKEDGTVKRGDLINTFGAAYNNIALMLAEVTEDAIESSVRENDKTYYSHVLPSYLGKLVKQLKDVREDPEKFLQFIETEFKLYEWFYDSKNLRWRSDWIEKLATDQSMRKALLHKVVLNYGKTAYQDWDDLDYTVVLLNEFFSEPKEKMAWYNTPILSDAPSAEFIRFVRYTNGSEIDPDTKKYRTFQEIITDKIIDVITLEYNRIQLVLERDEYILKGTILPIANFDIERDRDDKRKIKSKGGSEFKFFPELNTLTYKNGETFLQKFERLRNNSPSEFRLFLRDTILDIMEEGFESTYEEWVDIGLLDELPNGKLKNLPSNIATQGQSLTNQKVVKALETASKYIVFTKEMTAILNKLKGNKAINDKLANAVFEQIKQLLSDKVLKGEISSKEFLAITKDLTTKNNIKDALREYYWNSKFATSQIIEITTTDLAFYKNMEDFQKRFKEVHAPSTRLNTLATFRGKKVGRTWERTIYLADDVIVSSVIADIEEIFNEKVKRGEITKPEKDYIVSLFKKVNVADAQAYRSLSSYRAMMVMMGQWTDEMETAYEHLTDPIGLWTMEDFNIIWLTRKPFVYTLINNDSGIGGHTGIKTPVQHKNSEFLLLALYDAVAGPLGKQSKLKAINDFMERRGIDVVLFESTTKVGKQGTIDINDKAIKEELAKLQKDGKQHTEYDATISILERVTGIGQGKENPSVVHMVSYEDYGIQTATPEHAIDAVLLIGTLIRKLITADISDDALITIEGVTMTKAEWLKTYNEINTENILLAFKEVDEMFSDIKEVERVLKEEIRGNARYGSDMLRACTLDKNGNFNIPLYDPVLSQRILTLLNSIIKSRITKLEIKGGALIQVTSYGLSNDLKIVYEGTGENKRIKYLECYMPAYSREFYEPLMGKDGKLDINKLPDDLRKLIGYRVPTEDKYSMLPIYIKGFLPLQNGSAIMLPAEITTLSGSDFDVDKLYIMLPEFQIKKEYNIKAAWNDFYRSRPDIVEAIKKSKDFNFDRALKEALEENPDINIDDIDMDALFKKFVSEHKEYEWVSGVKEEFSKWFKERKQQYFVKHTIEKLKYDYSKPAHKLKSYRGDGGLARRNNALIDMMWGILTNPDTAPKMLNPGGFDKLKIAARVVTILDYMTEEELKKEGYTIQDILRMSYDTENLEILDKLASRAKRVLDPLSPRTLVILHQQNMTGGKMIGIYANHNANHAIILHTDLAIDDKNGSFKYGGIVRTSLHSIKNERGEFISRNNANYLAASVDNVKDNTLHATNQNEFTGDMTMLLSRLGYNPTEIAILMRLPIVMEITRKYFRERREGKSAETVIKEVISITSKYAGMKEDLSYGNLQNNTFDLETLMKDIMLYKDVANLSKADKINFYRRLVTVGLLFQRIMKTSEALSLVVNATRADTQGGAAGPTIADTMIKLLKVDDLYENIDSSKFPLIGAGDIIKEIQYNGDIDQLREDLLNSRLPFMLAFYTLGLRETERILGRYFPHFTYPFKEVLKSLTKMTKTGKLNAKTINNIYNDLLAYIMSRTEFFGDGINRDGKMISATEKRRALINNFPVYFKQIVNDNEDIAELEFILRLKVALHNDKNPIDVLVFKNVGLLSPTLRERYMRDWTTLLYMKNPKALELALNLFLYSYFRNGFAFGPSTFIHLAPVAIRTAIHDYIPTLRGLIEEQNDLSPFIELYIYNHLDNRLFVPEVPEESTIKFTDENGGIKDEVVITINKTSPSGDKTVVLSEETLEGTTVYTFFKFITKRIKGKNVYYRLTDTQGWDTAIYTRIEPLGYKNSFLEYEYGKPAHEIESVIDRNKKDYDPKSELLALLERLQSADDLRELMPHYSDNYFVDIAHLVPLVAFEEVYGDKPADTPKSDSNSITNIEPNDSYRDANDDEICSGDVIAVL